jgi:hypothetical protein
MKNPNPYFDDVLGSEGWNTSCNLKNRSKKMGKPVIEIFPKIFCNNGKSFGEICHLIFHAEKFVHNDESKPKINEILSVVQKENQNRFSIEIVSLEKKFCSIWYH